jgi:hypothetical protein
MKLPWIPELRYRVYFNYALTVCSVNLWSMG